MGARQKLNSANVLGARALAGLIGGATESWTAFLVTAALLIGGSMYVGDIRLRR